MTPRPLIFVSTVSRELRSARQLVANTLQFLGYEPVWQDIFGTESGDLRQMLREKVDPCKGVVQLVGHCYGAEPPKPDEHFGRCSYTQYEALYARQQGKKVWYLFLEDAFPADDHPAEPEELQQLQAAYRKRLQGDAQLYHPLNSREALEAQVLKLRDDLGRLRRGVKQWAAGVLALLILILAIGGWLVQRQSAANESLEELNKKLEQGVLQFASVQTQVKQQQPGQDPQSAEDQTYAQLAKNLGVDEKLLKEKLPKYADELRQSATAPPFERANAAYVAKDYAQAERLALEAAEEAQKASPPRTADAIQALSLAGWSAREQVKYADALEHFRKAANLTDRQADPLQWADLQYALGRILNDQGQYRRTEAVLREALDEFQRGPGPEDRRTLCCRDQIAIALYGQGKYAEAEQEHRAILAIRERVFGAEFTETLTSRGNLSNALAGQGKYAEAEKMLRELLPIVGRVYGPEHPETLTSRNNLANTLIDLGRYAEAEELLREILPIRQRVKGPEHPSTLIVRGNLAVALFYQGKYAEAEAENRSIMAIHERTLGPEHPETLTTRSNLALALQNQGKHAEAEQEYREILPTQIRLYGEEHPLTLTLRHNLASELDASGKHAESEQENRAVLAIRERVLGPEHQHTLLSRSNLAYALLNEAKYDEAEQMYRAALTVIERVFGPDNLDTLNARNNLAIVLFRQGKFAEAEKEYRTALDGRQRVLGEEHRSTLYSLNGLADSLAAQGRDEEATPLAQRAAESAKKILGPDHPDTKLFLQLVHELQNKKK